LLVESFSYDRDDLAWFRYAYRYFLGMTAAMPPQGRLNAGQKLHHAGVVITSFFVVASGLVLWLAKGSLGANGLAAAAMIHDLSMLILTVLLAGHLYFTFVYKALSSMVSGYVSEEEARLEHAKWVQKVTSKVTSVDSH
jgi:formate dehydrogenase subunit gamma